MFQHLVATNVQNEIYPAPENH